MGGESAPLSRMNSLQTGHMYLRKGSPLELRREMANAIDCRRTVRYHDGVYWSHHEESVG